MIAKIMMNINGREYPVTAYLTTDDLTGDMPVKAQNLDTSKMTVLHLRPQKKAELLMVALRGRAGYVTMAEAMRA